MTAPPLRYGPPPGHYGDPAVANAKLSRQGGLFAMLGSLLWVVCWTIVFFVGGGSRAERLWRTLLLNPAILLFMAGLWGFHVRQARRTGRLGKTGLALCLFGTGTMLLGNVVEFWVSEYFFGTQTPGWVMMGVGLTILPAGFLLLGIGTIRASVFTAWRRGVPLGFGVMLTAIVMLLATWESSQPLLARIFPYAVSYAFAFGWAAFGYALWSEKTLQPTVAADAPASGPRR